VLSVVELDTSKSGEYAPSHSWKDLSHISDSKKSKDGVNTATAEVIGDTSKVRGFHIAAMESGDKAFFGIKAPARAKTGLRSKPKATGD